MMFSDFKLAADILRAIDEAGYSEPTPIQSQAIPEIMAGRDLVGIAQTGTGKTAGFTLPMIHRLMQGRARARMPRSLILEPTRELAAQVADNFDTYGKHTRLTKALLIGGVSFTDQERAIERGADVLIATPGRLLDHVDRGKVLLRGVEVLVIDEADRMLDMGFIPDIEKILKLVPFTRQTLLFSATMPPEITKLADTFLSAPKRIEVARPASTNANVRQALVMVAGDKKRDALRTLLRNDDVKNAIIFCNRKRDVATLTDMLARGDFSAVALHGDMDQHRRLATLEKFKSGEAKFLVASDVAARGLDIANVSHVFNFDVPTHAEDYVHRIGRTGRASRTGTAYTLALASDDKYVAAIEKLIGQKIPLEDSGFDSGESTASFTPRPRKSRAVKREKSEISRTRNTKNGGKRRGLLRGNNVSKNDTPNSAFGDNAPAFLRKPPQSGD